MKVSDILRVKGNTLFTVSPDQPLHEAVVTRSGRPCGACDSCLLRAKGFREAQVEDR